MCLPSMHKTLDSIHNTAYICMCILIYTYIHINTYIIFIHYMSIMYKYKYECMNHEEQKTKARQQVNRKFIVTSSPHLSFEGLQ